ncbi:hypothetical protein SmJEL517_g02345 [Synchytrium microbalum]|uniref:Glucanase n=1 Tax=Synchytrium microbalum TaxID=1806994 RepID=A0A507C6T2_9FUNG|nr:uncharacterized protein SmJEL517_g02345 [Synchytrium microbalum]TPX35211.1 hypothetical protein SmJEL517_g02345 [Synchytrium microbalum]
MSPKPSHFNTILTKSLYTSFNLVLAQTAYNTPDGGMSTSLGNPFANTLQYVNPSYGALVNQSISLHSDNSTRVALYQKVATYPTFVWIPSLASISTISRHLSNAATQANGMPIVVSFVIYNIPGRDCSALASVGQIPPGALDQYKTQYIDPVFAQLALKQPNINLVLIIEPDALPNLIANNCTASATYPSAIAYAVSRFSALPNTSIYLDVGSGAWLGGQVLTQGKIAPVILSVMVLATAINPNASIRGFSSNLANFNPFNGNGACPAKQYCPLVKGAYNGNRGIDENVYTSTLNVALAAVGLPTRWLVDTSRSGQIGVRTFLGSWCNIQGAGLGDRPTSNPASQVDAFVWVKPPGNSDGASSGAGVDPHCVPTNPVGIDALGGAPAAGAWFDGHFAMLTDNASPPVSVTVSRLSARSARSKAVIEARQA